MSFFGIIGNRSKKRRCVADAVTVGDLNVADGCFVRLVAAFGPLADDIAGGVSLYVAVDLVVAASVADDDLALSNDVAVEVSIDPLAAFASFGVGLEAFAV